MLASNKRSVKTKKIIGTTDRIDFSDFGFENVKCKIDTGAMTSSIHCHEVRRQRDDQGEYITFKVLDPSHPQFRNRSVKVRDFVERKIRNSFGHSEYRYVVRTRVTLFGKTFISEFSLADREKMKYPVLLGKRLLTGRFLVDVAQRNLSFKHKKQLEL